MDRNLIGSINRAIDIMSLSARRAWIEMPWGGWGRGPPGVALRKESVDRNPPVDTSSVKVSLSLSARRAWIEIHNHTSHFLLQYVALRKESVDRNVAFGDRTHGTARRSPQGERG